MHTTAFKHLILAMLLLQGACSAIGIGPQLANPERAATLAQRNDHLAAALEYQNLAGSAEVQMANDYRLLAAQEWLAAKQGRPASALLKTLTAPISTTQSLKLNLLTAEAEWVSGNSASAWSLITAITPPKEIKLLNRYLTLSQSVAIATGHALEGISNAQARLSINRESSAQSSINNELLEDLRLAVVRGMNLDPRLAGKDKFLRGWLEAAPLAAYAVKLPGRSNAGAVLAWGERYPNHPAVTALEQLSLSTAGLSSLTIEPLTKTPKNILWPTKEDLSVNAHIAVLIPLTGRNSNAGMQLRDGLIAGFFNDDPNVRKPLRFYDTSSQRIDYALTDSIKSGAIFIIGPLGREEVLAAEAAAVQTPILALNFLSNEHPKTAMNFYQFALSPEDEARAVARRAIADGRRRGIAFAQSGDWGTRVLKAFSEELASSGGELLDSQTITNDRDISDVIQSALRIDDSRNRHKRLQNTLGLTLSFEPRRRNDIDFLFTPAPHIFAKNLLLHLRFYFAGNIPTYATSDILDERNAIQSNLDGVIFSDMPWILDRNLNTATKALHAASTAIGTAQGRGRLFAFGYDAYLIQTALRNSSSKHDNISLDGATGKLSVDTNGRVRRTLSWAEIHNNSVRLINSNER